MLLGLLGNEIRDNTAPPAPKPLPAPSFKACQNDPNWGQAANYPVQIITVDKGKEEVTLKNVSDQPVNLDGWHMCSIKGNQEHIGIGGPLAPGEQRVFKQQGGNIWANDAQDDGALYNAQGQLVSYWTDPNH